MPALVGGGWLALALAGLSATGVLGAGPWWLFGPATAALYLLTAHPQDGS
ncbi:hypothetical protein ACQEU6_36255 [Spirillospora sp. CA-108201]